MSSFNRGTALNDFYRNIKPHVQAEIDAARECMEQGLADAAFARLERAHVLGQESTILHTRVHWEMLLWGLGQRRVGEVLGQVLRLVGAATKTAVGLVPPGNTGGADVSPFREMPIPEDTARIIAGAKH